MVEYRRALSEDEIPTAFRNVYGDRTKKPLSVQMGELATDVLTPIGTINDISTELEKEDPSYVKIAGLAGLELLGTAAPIIEMAAKSGNKGMIQKAIDAWKKNEAENPSLDPNSAEAIEKQLEEKILFDDIDELTDAEKAEIQMEKLGPSDDQLKEMADELNFLYEGDLQKAYDKKIINSEEYLDNKYVLYSKKKAEYAKNPVDVKDLDLDAVIEKGFIDNYLKLFNYFDKKELLKVITEFPDNKDFLHIDYTKNILKPMANEANIPLNSFYETIEKLASEIGTTGQGLTTRPLPRARYSGDKVPEKPFLPTDTRGEIDEYQLPKEQRAALRRGNNLGFRDVVYHSSENVKGGFAKQFNQFLTKDQKWLADGNNNFNNLTTGILHDFLGTHVGTARAAAERSSRAVRNRGGFTMELKARLDKPATFDILVKESGVDFKDIEPGTIIGEPELRRVLEQAVDNQYSNKIRSNEDRINAVKTFRKRLAEKGYTHVPYINDVEDPTSISYIMLTDRSGDSRAVLRDIRAEFDPDKITSPDLRMAEGGPLMNKQMEMAFMKQGGIKDDGMTKDPVSGNDIPPGSMATEVRDNIPAMLSDGEYVVPADVLRYYGVNFFENLRGQAKNGLQSMEQNGRIGGTPMTQQDVARNMQQPVMANTGMMLEPEKQQSPQAMGNQTPGFSQPVQSFSQGTTNAGGPPNFTSSWTPGTARMNTPMFQGTSSQQANIATAQQNNPNQGAEVTVFKTHYNTNGETTQIKYVQMPGGTLQPAPGQDSELAKYPMTEAEWLAYKKGQGGGGGGGGGGGDTTPKGSDTTWMTEDGINWSNQGDVQAWADKTLKIDNFAQQIGSKIPIAGAFIGVGIGDSIAKVRAAALVQRDLGNNEFAKELEDQADAFLEKAPLSVLAMDKLGLITGKNYFKNFTITELDGKKVVLTENDPKVIKETERVFQNYASQVGEGIAAPSGGGTSDQDGYGGYTNQFTSYSGSDKPIVTQDSIDQTSNILATTADLEDTVSNLDDVTDKIEDFTSGVNTSGQTGFDKGGLMAAPKKKKKRQPKKGGLAGKK